MMISKDAREEGEGGRSFLPTILLPCFSHEKRADLTLQPRAKNLLSFGGRFLKDPPRTFFRSPCSQKK